MSQHVIITSGRYSTGRDSYREVKGVTFPLIDGKLTSHERGTYIVVDGGPVRGYPKRAFKMFVESGGFQITEGSLPITMLGDFSPSMIPGDNTELPFTTNEVLRGADDDEIKARIEERFQIIHKFVWAAVEGKARGLVISGPPGVGKSHTVEESLANSFAQQVEVANLLRGVDDPVDPAATVVPVAISGDEEDGEDPDVVKREVVPPGPQYRIISGHLAPMSLYQMLHDYRDEQCVLTFDDADSVLYDEKSLNLLKKAMNNKGTRIIDWGSRSVEAVGLPTSFEFKGSIIFITNLDFDSPKLMRSSIGEHLKAIISRVYYVDLGIKTIRDLFLRIDHVCGDGDLLEKSGLTKDESKEVMAFFEENIHKFRELSIRTVEKIAMTRTIDPSGWQVMSRVSTFRPEHA